MRVLTLLLLLCYGAMWSQSAITVTVKDEQTGMALPFTTITAEGKTFISDVDGSVTITEKLHSFNASYTGYKPKTVKVKPHEKYYTVLLEPYTEQLEELVITANKTASAIIKQAIANKPLTDPTQKLNSFKYHTYNRLVVTANPDSISGKLDSVYVYEKAGRRFEKIDSTDFKFKKLIDRQHLYQTEKISEYKFLKGVEVKENVLATRMAGFKQPLYELIGLKLQSYSVYGEHIDLMENKYAGPLAGTALSEYNYKILDTVTIENRSAYMIYFSPKKYIKRRLKGILYIDTETYGVAKAVFRAKNVLDVNSTHYYKYEPELQLWFPDHKILKIVKGNSNRDITILGETIKFDPTDDQETKREKEPSDYLYLLSESFNFDKQYNIPVTITNPSIAIEIDNEAINRPESFWNRYRTDTLDERSIKTYVALDSLLAKEKWEERLILGRHIINGYLPVGPVDLDLRQIIKYNNYEGFRLGIGFITNDKLAQTFRINTYGVYGTKDGQFKYSLGGGIRAQKASETWMGGSYTDDIREIGSTSFLTDKKVFKIYDPRPINVSTFYNHQSWEVYAETKFIPKTESKLTITRSRINPKFDYTFTPDDVHHNIFNLTTVAMAVQWNPFSEFMLTPQGRLESEKHYPKFTFQYTRSFSGIFDSDFHFAKFDFRVEAEKKYLNGQISTGLIQTGLAAGQVPLTHLYSTSPNNLDKNGVFERITFAGKNSFETMYFNEFFSSRYVMAQLKHGFTRFTISNSIKLSPMLVTRFAWGAMDNKDDHQGLAYNTLEKGYYESGMEFNEIFKGLGFSAFYRYGPYHLPQLDRNISVKISFMIKLL
ncbi:DUF5686 family protein [Flavobacterium rhizosphaerae]|uniref:DUF5686 family protein n=1 Tax=Flavobacterium rhizosphaerae TaxID=3163298 RepID=A0ABW8YYY3_9FLAO